MAGCDYYSCDICGCKTFYDAEVDYESGNRVGAMKCICKDCAKRYDLIIVPRCPYCGSTRIGRDMNDTDPCEYFCHACGEAFDGEGADDE
jgi:hypothetical protein